MGGDVEDQDAVRGGVVGRHRREVTTAFLADGFAVVIDHQHILGILHIFGDQRTKGLQRLTAPVYALGFESVTLHEPFELGQGHPSKECVPSAAGDWRGLVKPNVLGVLGLRAQGICRHHPSGKKHD